MTRLEKTKISLAVSSKFEGNSPWSNITGNFDDAGLTCGSLGWTVEWDNQDPLVLAFVERHGESRGHELMPQKWQDYIDVIRDPARTALVIVNAWSSNGNVVEPYKTELRTFWESPEMVAIQVEFADQSMGAFADKNANDFCALYEVPFAQKIFDWFFDIAVNNGSMKSVKLSDGGRFQFSELESWANNKSVPAQYQGTLDDLKTNLDIWRPIYPSLMQFEKCLVGLSFYRSLLARSQFQVDVLNRKATIVFGKGFVHGDKYEF